MDNTAIMFRTAFSLLLLVVIWSCSEECTDKCQFEGTTRVEVVDLYGLDTLWYEAPQGAILTYEGSDGSEIEYEVTNFSIDSFIAVDDIACGECGDSIVRVRNTQTLTYSLRNVADQESWSVNLSGNRFYPDTSLLYKCVRGTVNYLGFGDTITETFLGGCNVLLDSTRIRRLNSLYHNFSYATDFDSTLFCPTDSLGLFTTLDSSDLKYIELGFDAPIRRFRRKNVCYEYKGFR